MLSVKGYQEKVLKKLSTKDKELAEVELQNRKLFWQIWQVVNWKTKLQKQNAFAASAALSLNARSQASLNPKGTTGTIPKVPQLTGVSNIEQSSQDREARKSCINLDIRPVLHQTMRINILQDQHSQGWLGIRLELFTLVVNHQIMIILPEIFSQI